MNISKKFIILSLLLASTVSISSVSALGLDFQTGIAYDKNVFSAKVVNGLLLKSYTNQLQELKGPRSLFYQRYIEDKMTTDDKRLLTECGSSQSCKNDRISAMKYIYDTRSESMNLISLKKQAFQDRVAVDAGTGKVLNFIELKYGKAQYDWIIKNRQALDSAFDKFLVKEREAITLGKFSTIVDASNTPVKIETFQSYVNSIGWKKLETAKNKSKTRLSKAAYEYYQYRLLTDERLFMK